jgi:hypothetical protein
MASTCLLYSLHGSQHQHHAELEHDDDFDHSAKHTLSDLLAAKRAPSFELRRVLGARVWVRRVKRRFARVLMAAGVRLHGAGVASFGVGLAWALGDGLTLPFVSSLGGAPLPTASLALGAAPAGALLGVFLLAARRCCCCRRRAYKEQLGGAWGDGGRYGDRYGPGSGGGRGSDTGSAAAAVGWRNPLLAALAALVWMAVVPGVGDSSSGGSAAAGVGGAVLGLAAAAAASVVLGAGDDGRGGGRAPAARRAAMARALVAGRAAGALLGALQWSLASLVPGLGGGGGGGGAGDISGLRDDDVGGGGPAGAAGTHDAAVAAAADIVAGARAAFGAGACLVAVGGLLAAAALSRRCGGSQEEGLEEEKEEWGDEDEYEEEWGDEEGQEEEEGGQEQGWREEEKLCQCDSGERRRGRGAHEAGLCRALCHWGALACAAAAWVALCAQSWLGTSLFVAWRSGGDGTAAMQPEAGFAVVLGGVRLHGAWLAMAAQCAVGAATALVLRRRQAATAAQTPPEAARAPLSAVAAWSRLAAVHAAVFTPLALLAVADTPLLRGTLLAAGGAGMALQSSEGHGGDAMRQLRAALGRRQPVAAGCCGSCGRGVGRDGEQQTTAAAAAAATAMAPGALAQLLAAATLGAALLVGSPWCCPAAAALGQRHGGGVSTTALLTLLGCGGLSLLAACSLLLIASNAVGALASTGKDRWGGAAGGAGVPALRGRLLDPSSHHHAGAGLCERPLPSSVDALRLCPFALLAGAADDSAAARGSRGGSGVQQQQQRQRRRKCKRSSGGGNGGNGGNDGVAVPFNVAHHSSSVINGGVAVPFNVAQPLKAIADAQSPPPSPTFKPSSIGRPSAPLLEAVEAEQNRHSLSARAAAEGPLAFGSPLRERPSAAELLRASGTTANPPAVLKDQGGESDGDGDGDGGGSGVSAFSLPRRSGRSPRKEDRSQPPGYASRMLDRERGPRRGARSPLRVQHLLQEQRSPHSPHSPRSPRSPRSPPQQQQQQQQQQIRRSSNTSSNTSTPPRPHTPLLDGSSPPRTPSPGGGRGHGSPQHQAGSSSGSFGSPGELLEALHHGARSPMSPPQCVHDSPVRQSPTSAFARVRRVRPSPLRLDDALDNAPDSPASSRLARRLPSGHRGEHPHTPVFTAQPEGGQAPRPTTPLHL